MEYNTNKESYKNLVKDMVDQISEILDSGSAVEISKSRSGLKLYRVNRRHEVLKHKRKEN